MKLGKRVLLCVLAISSLFLSGCFAGRLHCEVHRDGSSEMRLGLGVDSELSHLAGLGGRNWFEELGVEPGAQIEKEVAGGMNWQYTTLMLDTLEELEERINGMEWGEASITKRGGILFDTFEFRVQGTEPMFDEEDAEQFDSESVDFDPSGYVDLTWELILPGKVVEHNGSNVDPETNQITWYPDASQPLSIYARSRAFNAWIIPLVAVALLVAFGILVAVLLLAASALRKSRGPVRGAPPDVTTRPMP